MDDSVPKSAGGGCCKEIPQAEGPLDLAWIKRTEVPMADTARTLQEITFQRSRAIRPAIAGACY